MLCMHMCDSWRGGGGGGVNFMHILVGKRLKIKTVLSNKHGSKNLCITAPAATWKHLCTHIGGGGGDFAQV